MKRKCIIVGNPGVANTDGYCEGVNVDIKNYLRLLKSPVGGLWQTNEISPPMICPSVYQLDSELKKVGQDEYLLFVFCGHGFYSSTMKSTILELSKDVHFDSNKLKAIGGTKLTILDCCRKSYSILVQDHAFSESIAKFATGLDATKCRAEFDKSIDRNKGQSIVTYACNIDEKAGDDSREGGYYSSTLIDVARSLENRVLNQTYSIVKCHDQACVGVISKSGNKQHPQIEKPRESEFIPFAVSY